ncbi:MAG: hypothetical protein AAGI01_02565 [Myxococcota bacterium]
MNAPHVVAPLAPLVLLCMASSALATDTVTLSLRAVPRKAPERTEPSAEALTQQDKRQQAEVRRLTKEKIAELAVARIQRRLRAAEIKQADVRIGRQGSIDITVHGAPSRPWVEGLVLSPGRMEVRPSLDEGVVWIDVLDRAQPDGVELRQERAGDFLSSYAWSTQRDPLDALLKLAPPSGALYAVGPDPRGGWRTWSLGAPVVREHEIAAARVQTTSTGSSYVAVQLKPGAAGALRGAGKPERYGVLIDGEFIASLPRPQGSSRSSFVLDCPASLGGQQARRDCARQVAGRLSAPIPVLLAPLP